MSGVNNNMKGWTLLKNVADEQEAVLVESILREEGIPILRKHKAGGGFMQVYMGMSRYGIDLFVPEDAAPLAKVLLDSEMIDALEETNTEEIVKAEKKYQTKRRSIVWIILMYLILPVVAAIILDIIINSK